MTLDVTVTLERANGRREVVVRVGERVIDRSRRDVHVLPDGTPTTENSSKHRRAAARQAYESRKAAR